MDHLRAKDLPDLVGLSVSGTETITRTCWTVRFSDEEHWLRRAVDQGGLVLDVFLQRHRITKDANLLKRKLLKGQGHPPYPMISAN